MLTAVNRSNTRMTIVLDEDEADFIGRVLCDAIIRLKEDERAIDLPDSYTNKDLYLSGQQHLLFTQYWNTYISMRLGFEPDDPEPGKSKFQEELAKVKGMAS